MKGRGWHKESYRHSLAARGVRTMRADAVFRPYRPTGPIDYSDPRETFFAFWKASLEDNWENFNFDKAFKEAEYLYWEEMARHGAFGGDAFIEMLARDDIYWSYADNKTIFDELVESTSFKEGVSQEDQILGRLNPKDRAELTEALATEDFDALSDETMGNIADATTEIMWEHHAGDPVFARIELTYDDLRNPSKTLAEKIALYDRIIHTQHYGGNIWEYKDADIEKLREEFDQVYGVTA